MMHDEILNMLTKLKFRKMGRNCIYTGNNGLFIRIFYDNDVINSTNITIEELDRKICDLYYEGNILNKFTVISDVDYIKQRIQIEI